MIERRGSEERRRRSRTLSPLFSPCLLLIRFFPSLLSSRWRRREWREEERKGRGEKVGESKGVRGRRAKRNTLEPHHSTKRRGKNVGHEASGFETCAQFV